MTADPPEVIVLRHGETVWNRAGRWQGRRDSPLTDAGVRQAQVLGGMFARMGIGPKTHHILSSPQGRAKATAAHIFGPGFSQDDDLAEIDMGAWTGMGRGHADVRSILPEGADMLTLYGSVPGGETFEALEHRCRRVLSRLAGPSVLVTHGITGRILRVVLLGRPIPTFQDLPGGQGIAFRIRGGIEEILRPDPSDVPPA